LPWLSPFVPADDLPVDDRQVARRAFRFRKSGKIVQPLTINDLQHETLESIYTGRRRLAISAPMP
jgi:hypothetical protein